MGCASDRLGHFPVVTGGLHRDFQLALPTGEHDLVVRGQGATSPRFRPQDPERRVSLVAVNEFRLHRLTPQDLALFESFAAMLTLITVLGIALCLVMVLGNAAIGLDLSLVSIVAGTLGLMLTGVFFGALALSLGAATGSTGIARGVPAAVAIGGFLLNGLGAVVAGTAPLRYLSPIYWFLGDTPPLLRGFSVGSPVLLGAALIAVGIGAWAFERRDLVR